MKPREKILAAAVAGFAGLLVLGFGARAFFLAPLRKIDKETALLREKITKIAQERRDYFDAEDGLRALAQRSFAGDLNQASARSGEMITKQIALAGLSEADFTRLPVGPRKLRGASEIGWSIQGKGDLRRIVNLLHLLGSVPQVHRIESITLGTHDRPGEIRVRLLFLTLVLEPAPEFDPIELKPGPGLESPERLAYNAILDRDLLRPYIKAPAPATAPGSPSSTVPAGPEGLRVVSLSEWEGRPEVHLRDALRTLRFKPGDKLEDGSEIVAVDYRPMPLPRNPLLLSHSRVILKLGADFWAVERGETLAEKRKLDQTQWPAP